MERLLLDGKTLKLEDLLAVSRREVRVAIAPAARATLEQGQQPPGPEAQRLRNRVLSHAAALGQPIRTAEVRALMLLLANALSRGGEGVRLATADLLLEMLDHNCIPIVPEGGLSDPAALAHLALVLGGDGEAFLDGRRLPGGEALSRLELRPVVLQPGEGHLLLDGGEPALAVGALALLRAGHLAGVADLAGALTLAGLQVSPASLLPDPPASESPGRMLAAAHLRDLLAGSPALSAPCPDAILSLPKVHGTARDDIALCRDVLGRELNTPEPAVNQKEPRGPSMATALELLARAAAQLTELSLERVELLVSAPGLPAFLTPRPDLHFGFKAAPLTHSALVAQNRLHCQPGPPGIAAAIKTRQVVENLRTGLAIELLAAAQAIDLRRPLRPWGRLAEAHARIRGSIPHLDEDRILHREIESMCRLIDDGVMEM